MRSLHKIQLAVLSLLVALLLAACSSNATPTTSSTATGGAATPTSNATATGSTVATPEPTFAPAATNQTPVAPSGAVASPSVGVLDPGLKTTLSIWSTLSGSQTQLLSDQIKQFMQAYPGVKVTVTQYNPDEVGSEFQSAVAAGNGPDLVIATSDNVANFTAANVVQPVDSLINSQAYAANALGTSNVGGKQYGVPYIYGNTLVLLYNKKLIPTPPTDTNQLIQMAQSVVKNSNNAATTNRRTRVEGLVVDLNEPYDFVPWVYGFGGSLLDASGQPTLDSSATTQALQFFYDLAYKDKLASPSYEPALNRADYAFRDGTLAFYITTDQNAMNYASTISASSGNAKAQNNKIANDVGLDLGVAPLPKVTATGKNPTPFTDSQAIFVSAKTSGDQLKAAKNFLSFVGSPVQQTYMAAHYRLLPPTTAGLSSDAVKSDAVLSGIAAQLAVALPQPNQLQMQAIWSAIRPNLEQVVAGVVKPQQAVQTMQQTALSQIKSLGLTKP